MSKKSEINIYHSLKRKFSNKKIKTSEELQVFVFNHF